MSSKQDSSDLKAVPLQHTTLATCLTATCERSGVFENVTDSITKRMSTSRIRFSVITELVCLGEDSLDNIAYCFGKHTKQVCKKFMCNFGLIVKRLALVGKSTKWPIWKMKAKQ